MKTKFFKPLWLLGGIAAFALSAQGQNSAFTYQGRLTDGINPANGMYDMRFSLHDADTAGTSLTTPLVATIPTTNGLFTVLLDFGSAPFNGDLRWLEVGVRPGGSSSGTTYVPQLPRTKLTPTPYAIYAQKAGSVANGAINSSQLAANAITAPKIADGQVVKSINGLKDSVNIVAGSNITLSTNGSNLMIASSGAGTLGDQIVSGNISFGSQVRQMLNLWNSVYGVGVQNGNLYLRSDDGFAWHQDGVHSDNHFDPGAGGKTLMKLDDNGLSTSGNGSFSGDLTAHSVIIPGGFRNRANQGEFIVRDYSTPEGPFNLPARFTVKQDGRVGIGTDNPSEKLHVNGAFLRVEGARGEAAYLGGDGAGNDVQVGSFNPSVQNLVAWNVANGVMNFSCKNLYASGEAKVAGPYLTVEGAGGERAYIGGDGAGNDVQVGSLNPSVTDIYMYNAGNGTIMHTHVGCLTIHGGCDLAEPFPMKEEGVEKGAVVIIDDEHPGQLQRSTRAYDTRVAGIISGANGIRPGIALKQEGTLDRGDNVALSGRVYVQADARYGAIKPGDLLTTSDTPGHAMKVIDSSRAQGAVLGKAMTPLAQGTGFVLVLVSLQ
jgi:hypothetical protein